MPKRKIKPDEVKIREQQMKKFRYDAAHLTGLALSILGNGFIILTFAIFMISFISGLFEGVDAGTSWNESFALWKMVCDTSLLTCVAASSLLALAVRVLSHDAKGRDMKKMRKATDRSLFTLLVFMSSVSILYIHSQS